MHNQGNSCANAPGRFVRKLAFAKSLTWVMLLMLLFRRGGAKVLTTILSGPVETVEPRPLCKNVSVFILLQTTGHMTPYTHGFKALLDQNKLTEKFCLQHQTGKDNHQASGIHNAANVSTRTNNVLAKLISCIDSCEIVFML